MHTGRCEIEVALRSLTLFDNYVDVVRTADDGGFLFSTGEAALQIDSCVFYMCGSGGRPRRVLCDCT
jgi:hypothetical protein